MGVFKMVFGILGACTLMHLADMYIADKRTVVKVEKKKKRKIIEARI